MVDRLRKWALKMGHARSLLSRLFLLHALYTALPVILPNPGAQRGVIATSY